MALIQVPVLWPLVGETWEERDGLASTLGYALVDLEGPDADCPKAAAHELLTGGSIVAWLEDKEGRQFSYDLILADFERANAELSARDMIFGDFRTFMRDLLLIACLGESAFQEGTP